LQFNKDFTFRDATGLLDYFSELGITHIYASPIWRSRPGSTHGYDVIDPTRLNPELGTEADFFTLQTELRNRGMGLVLDIVPNHMSASSDNSWWMDVLEHGPESAYASYFDIDWHPPSRSLESKILLPVLGRPFAEVLRGRRVQADFFGRAALSSIFRIVVPIGGKNIPGNSRQEHRKTPRKARRRIDRLSGILRNRGRICGIALACHRDPGEAGEKRFRFEARERLRQLVSSSAEVEAFLNDRLRELMGQPR